MPSQFLELLQKITLHVAQHFLGQQAKLCILLARKWKADTFQGLPQLHLRQELRGFSHFLMLNFLIYKGEDLFVVGIARNTRLNKTVLLC